MAANLAKIDKEKKKKVWHSCGTKKSKMARDHNLSEQSHEGNKSKSRKSQLSTWWGGSTCNTTSASQSIIQEPNSSKIDCAGLIYSVLRNPLTAGRLSSAVAETDHLPMPSMEANGQHSR
ncbi:hypothetical protein N7475_009618 [Penicillium sp. IBT 31633x]|nr:hypothetical protein N7475_009618 [Penicillium sp. IBT 31633x]